MEPILFSDDLKITAPFMLLDSKSFKEHTLKHFKGFDQYLPSKNNFKGKVVEIGEKVFTFKRFTKNQLLDVFDDNNNKAKLTFDDDVFIPVLEDKNEVWMSHTPMEVITCMKGIDLADGKVLMGGLGLGYMARRILEKENVEHLTIYEIDKNVLEFFGNNLLKEYPDKITLINESIYKANENLYDTILVDIYPSFGDANSDDELELTFPDFHFNPERYWAWGNIDTTLLEEQDLGLTLLTALGYDFNSLNKELEKAKSLKEYTVDGITYAL